MVQVSDLGGPDNTREVEQQLIQELVKLFGYEHVEFSTEAPSIGNKV